MSQGNESGRKGLVWQLFRSIVRPALVIAVKQGITFPEIVSTLKHLIVEVCGDECAGRADTSTVDIALRTGIDRKDVAAIRKRHVSSPSPDIPDSWDHQHKLGRILDAWHTHPEFADKEKPRMLDRNALNRLIAPFRGNITHGAIVRYLRSNDVVREDDCGYFAAQRRWVFPPLNTSTALAQATNAAQGFLATLLHNVTATAGDTRFERRAIECIPSSRVPLFRQLVNVEGQRFLERVDSFLRDERSLVSSDDTIWVGVGLHWIEK